MLDTRGERTLAEVGAELVSIIGNRLVTLAVYGSAAGGDYVPGVSDLNFVAVVDELDIELLRAARSQTARWAKRGVATPLLLERSFLSTASDVFPMELADIGARHRLIAGEDSLVNLDIDPFALRRQCEREARGKLLRLRELYLEIGETRRGLRELMIDSARTFLVVVRNVNRLGGLPESEPGAAVLRDFAASFGHELTTLQRLIEIGRKRQAWQGDEETVFRSYLEDLSHLVGVIDDLERSRAGGGGG